VLESFDRRGGIVVQFSQFIVLVHKGQHFRIVVLFFESFDKDTFVDDRQFGIQKYNESTHFVDELTAYGEAFGKDVDDAPNIVAVHVETTFDVALEKLAVRFDVDVGVENALNFIGPDVVLPIDEILLLSVENLFVLSEKSVLGDDADDESVFDVFMNDGGDVSLLGFTSSDALHVEIELVGSMIGVSLIVAKRVLQDDERFGG
jgi:hypothetical protein